MADLARIKGNVAKMAAQNAPEADIDGYIASEGVTVDDVRNFKSSAPAQGFAQRFAGQQPSSNIVDATPQPNVGDKLLNATKATVNGLVDAVPGLQQGTDALMGAGGMLLGKDYGETVRSLQQRRADIAKASPFARASGDIAGSIVAPLSLGSKALGLSGKFGERILNSGLSMAGYEGAQSMAHGKGGADALKAMGQGALGGVIAPFVGAGLEKAGGAVADALTSGAQRKLTTTALESGAPTARDLKDAGAALLESATGGNSPAISGSALDRFMGGVQKSLEKYRPNSANDPKAVGLLQHLSELVQAAKTPGVVVDLKDLHLARQLAQKVGQSSEGRDSAIGNIVAGKINDFVKSLKPGDILGGADPKQAANDLIQGISTWSRAQKVSLIENAVKAADTYKSGYENGLKLSFLKLMKTPDFERLSAIEKEAIRVVAKGTTKQNIAEGLGKLGFSLGGSASHNILGGTAGTGILTTALAPFLGPAAFPVALGTTTVAGAAGRRIAEHIASSGAQRAAQIVATPGIPVARQVPNMLAPARVPLEILIRGGAGGAMSR